ncbi:MAG: 4Fe-4S dicluster domain-containing protein [Dehalococcoidia bacterium]|nr:MAG: 4Fe-4S dicluster domain-containing protein [Dehalococcoidia bacterium]
MMFFTVDRDKCNLCGDCLDECAFRLLEMKTKDSLPTARDVEFRSAEERCIDCGHCVAVCPTGALTLQARTHAGREVAKQGPEDCLPILPELIVSPEQVAQLLMARRTFRAYHDKPVPRETLEKIIRVARYAPSSHNTQAENWLVISDKMEIRRLGQTVIDWMRSMSQEAPEFCRAIDADVIVDLWEKGEDSVFRGAPHLIILHGDSYLGYLNASRDNFAVRLAYFELAAVPYGLGTVWGGFLVAALQLWPPAQKAIGLPEGQEAFDAMSIGYPKNQYRRIPMRNEPSLTWR